jgi:hypothetical protein
VEEDLFLGEERPSHVPVNPLGPKDSPAPEASNEVLGLEVPTLGMLVGKWGESLSPLLGLLDLKIEEP